MDMIVATEATQAVREFLARHLHVGAQGQYSQRNEVIRAMGRAIGDWSSMHGDEPDTVRERLRDALDLVDRLRLVLNAEWRAATAEGQPVRDAGELAALGQKIWYRGDPVSVFNDGFDSRFYREIDSDELAALCARYLCRPWMQCGALDWIFIDAFLHHETVQFGEDVKMRLVDGPKDDYGLNKSYFLARGHAARMQHVTARLTLWQSLAKLTAFGLVPVAGLAWLFAIGRPATALAGASLCLVALAMWAVVNVLQRLIPSAEQLQLRRALDLLHDMQRLYYFTGGPALNPGFLRDELKAVTGRGARYNTALYALLDMICKRDAALLVSQPASAYDDA